MSNGDTTVEEMLENLEEAKQLDTTVDESACENCNKIDADTRLVKRDHGDKPLHHCAECGRLLSTAEFTDWVDWQ